MQKELTQFLAHLLINASNNNSYINIRSVTFKQKYFNPRSIIGIIETGLFIVLIIPVPLSCLNIDLTVLLSLMVIAVTFLIGTQIYKDVTSSLSQIDYKLIESYDLLKNQNLLLTYPKDDLYDLEIMHKATKFLADKLQQKSTPLTDVELTTWIYVTYAIIIGKKQDVNKLLNSAKLQNTIDTLVTIKKLNLDDSEKYRQAEKFYIESLTEFNNNLRKLLDTNIMTDINHALTTHSDLLKYLPKHAKENYVDSMLTTLH